jgi:LysR family nitrogen assimilation transcriptional regulator
MLNHAILVLPKTDDRMELKTLQAFCSVAEHGSFGRAAAALGLAQSVLSRQVSALEAELGGRLFHRTGRGAVLSEFGTALVARARAVLAESGQLAAEARGERDSPSGTVDVGIVPGWAQPLVTTLTNDLVARYPRIRLRVHEGYSGQIEAWLASGQIQVAVFNRYRGGTVRGAERVARSPMMLVGPKGHPALRGREIAFRELGAVALCGPLRPNGMTTVMLEVASRLGISLNFVLEGSSSGILRHAVEQCGLCTVFPRPFVEREMAGSRFSAVRIVKPSLEQMTWLAVGSHRPATIAVRTVAGLTRRILTRDDAHRHDRRLKR